MLAKKILTFQIFLDDCSLLLGQNHPEEGSEVGTSVVNWKESLLVLLIHNEIEVFLDLTGEFSGKGVTRVFWISSHGFNDELNLLQRKTFTKQLLIITFTLTLIVGTTK